MSTLMYDDTLDTTTPEPTDDARRQWVRRLALPFLALFLAVGAFMTVMPQQANAAAYPVGVYAPSKINGSQAKGWANLSRDCGGTLGCYNYIKIERSRWYGVQYMGGSWANNNGWNSITANVGGGCFNYRTTTDSYNDVAGGYGAGVNIGQVGTSSNGTKVYRYRNTWSSGWTWICA